MDTSVGESTARPGTETSRSKPGAEPFLACMICEQRFQDQENCPTCDVPLSLVRCCPGCNKLLSAKHERCIYCSEAFVEEEQAEEPVVVRPARKKTRDPQQQLRAILVSIGSFAIVFLFSVIMWQQMDKLRPSPPRIIATSYALRSADLKSSPATSASTVGTLSAGDIIRINNFATGDRKERWLLLQKDQKAAYVPSDVVAPPKAMEQERGFEVLRFYLEGFNQEQLVQEAKQAVDYYAKAYPVIGHVEQLRWLLASRLRLLARHSAESAKLLENARQQYEMIAFLNGSLADQARALTQHTVPLREETGSEPSPPRSGNGIEILDSRTAPQNTAGFPTSPAHEVAILDQSDITVRTETSGPLAAGSQLGCGIARTVYANGLPIIPAGSRCTLQVNQSGGNSAALSLTLASFEVRGRRYQVSTTSVEVAGRTAPRASTYSFRLTSPVAVTR